MLANIWDVNLCFLEPKYISSYWLYLDIRFIAPNFISLAFNIIIQAADTNVETFRIKYSLESCNHRIYIRLALIMMIANLRIGLTMCHATL